jgi:hypothetical protein
MSAGTRHASPDQLCPRSLMHNGRRTRKHLRVGRVVESGYASRNLRRQIVF